MKTCNQSFSRIKFGIKFYDICESSLGYLWQFIIYIGVITEVQTVILSRDVQKTTQSVMKFVEPFKMDNYYSSPELSFLLKQKGINLAAKLRLNWKEVPITLRQEKIKHGELVTYHSQAILIMKGARKKTSVLHFFHPQQSNEGARKWESQLLGVVDFKLYLTQRKRCEAIGWFMNTAVHNSLITCNTIRNNKRNHFNFGIQLIQEILESHGRALKLLMLEDLQKHPCQTG